MRQECMCGDNCPVCDDCRSPQCECYCDLESTKKNNGETEDELDNEWW